MKNNKFLLVTLLITIAILALFMASCGKNSSPEIDFGVDNNGTGGTLTQEAAVDEGDIVKMFGENIYKLQSDGLRVYKANKGNILPVCHYNFSSPRNIPLEMYVTDEKIMVIYGRVNNLTYFDRYSPEYDIFYNQTYDKTFIEVFKNPNSENFAHDATVDFDLADYKDYNFSMNGTLVASRMYVSSKKAYFAIQCNQSFTYSDKFEDVSNVGIEKLPTISYQENGESKLYTNTEKIPHASNLQQKNTTPTVFVSLNPEDTQSGATIGAVYGATLQDIYMSETSIIPIFNEHIRTKSTAGCYYSVDYKNYAYVFKLHPETLKIVDGIALENYNIYDRRAIKDFGDTIFVTATKNDGTGTTIISISAQTFSYINKLQKIAPYEQVKSVTYGEEDGKRYCYITTYRNYDPLFKVDITDPSGMLTVGQLEMPGFATFMISVGDKLVTLGYGDNGGQHRNSTLVLSLYDAAGDGLTTIDKLYISNVYYCEAISDPRAICVFGDCLAFSATYSYTIKSYETAQALFLFRITDTEIQNIGVLSNFNVTSANVIDYDVNYADIEGNLMKTTSAGKFGLSVSRARYYDGYIYTFADAVITSYKVEINGNNITIPRTYTSRVFTTDVATLVTGEVTQKPTVTENYYLKSDFPELKNFSQANVSTVRYESYSGNTNQLHNVLYSVDEKDIAAAAKLLNEAYTLDTNFTVKGNEAYEVFTFTNNNGEQFTLNFCGGRLKINDKYYIPSANIIKPATVSSKRLTFKENTVSMVCENQIFVATYNWDNVEFVVSESSDTTAYVLKTIGFNDISVLNSNCFLFDGTVYEIVSGKDFTEILKP